MTYKKQYGSIQVLIIKEEKRALSNWSMTLIKPLHDTYRFLLRSESLPILHISPHTLDLATAWTWTDLWPGWPRSPACWPDQIPVTKNTQQCRVRLIPNCHDYHGSIPKTVTFFGRCTYDKRRLCQILLFHELNKASKGNLHNYTELRKNLR